jgi:hypothetical protein
MTRLTAKETDMSKKYEIHSGRRVVSTQFSVSASQAVIDYVRSYGVKDDEITRLGVDCVSWRGARFKAVLVPTEARLASR